MPEQFASPGGQRSDAALSTYTLPASLALNQWGLSGRWTITDEAAQLQQAGGRIAFQFHAPDLHLVLAPGRARKERRCASASGWDGKPLPAADAGSDVGAGWAVAVASTSTACTQLVRRARHRSARTASRSSSSIAGVQAYAFTFG